jgi:tetratricopeptide (TPR) repeat protein
VSIPFAPPGICDETSRYEVVRDIDEPWSRYHFLACQNWNEGRKREAMKYFKESLKLRSTEFYVWNDRARANFGLGRYDQAWKDLEQAVKLEKTDGVRAFAKEWQGLILLKWGKTRKSLNLLNEAITYWPDGAQLHYERGVILQTNRDFDRAVIDYDLALELGKKQEHPDLALRARSLFNKALCLKKIGRISEANLAMQSASAYLDLNDRREMFGAPGEPIRLATLVGSMVVDRNDER